MTPPEQEEATPTEQPTAQEEPRRHAEREGRPGRPAAPPPGKLVQPSEAALDMERILRDALAPLAIEFDSEYNFGELNISLPAQSIAHVCSIIKEDPRLDFDYLRCLSALDWEDSLEMVYHLYSMTKGHKLVLKARLPNQDPVIDSVTTVWRGADWHEREAAEMFGINFVGHPELEPLLLEEGVEEHPLLKSHPLVPVGEDRPGIIRSPDDTG